MKLVPLFNTVVNIHSTVRRMIQNLKRRAILEGKEIKSGEGARTNFACTVPERINQVDVVVVQML